MLSTTFWLGTQEQKRHLLEWEYYKRFESLERYELITKVLSTAYYPGAQYDEKFYENVKTDRPDISIMNEGLLPLKVTLTPLKIEQEIPPERVVETAPIKEVVEVFEEETTALYENTNNVG